MRGFDYHSFKDLSQIFSWKKGQPSPALAWRVYVPVAAVETPVSRFADLAAFKSIVRSRFIPAPVVNDPIVNNIVIKLDIPRITARFVTASAKPQKARTTLKLKTKVEIPTVASISRNSTAQDLATAFKAEMKMLEKKSPAEIDNMPTKAFGITVEKRRHPLSHKTWAELLAEVEAPKKKKDFDLAAAFKVEMQAMLAEQQRLEAVGIQKPDVAPIRFKTAFENKVKSPAPVPHPRPAARFRSMAA